MSSDHSSAPGTKSTPPPHFESKSKSIPISLKGRVVWARCENDLDSAEPFSAAVAFETLPPEVRQELEWVLEERARGPATLRVEGEDTSRKSHEVEQHAEKGAGLEPPETRSEDLLHGERFTSLRTTSTSTIGS